MLGTKFTLLFINTHIKKELIMKLQAITLTALIALTGTASANWFDGFNNGMGNGNAYGNGAANGTTAGNGAGNAQANGTGWGTGKGDADGEVNFSISFKGKGGTNMDTAGNLTGNGQGAGNTAANANGATNMAGNGLANGSNVAGSNGAATTSNFAPAGFNPSFSGTAPTATVATQDYTMLKAQWEAQAKQAAEMLKRIEAAQKAAATKS